MGEGAKRSEAQRQLTPGHRRYKAYAGSTASTVRVQIYLEIKAKHFCCYLLKHLELISGDQIQNLKTICVFPISINGSVFIWRKHKLKDKVVAGSIFPALSCAEVRLSMEAANGTVEKLILFTFNLLFPLLWNLERLKSCNTCIKNKWSRMSLLAACCRRLLRPSQEDLWRKAIDTPDIPAHILE